MLGGEAVDPFHHHVIGIQIGHCLKGQDPHVLCDPDGISAERLRVCAVCLMKGTRHIISI